MRVPLKCFLAATLCCHLQLQSVLAQEDGNAIAANVQEQVALAPLALAVLPIEILTENPRAPTLAAEAYEAILNELAAIEGLYVFGRELMLPYADSTLTPMEIARSLGLGSIVESNIRAEPIGMLIDVKLVDAQTGESHGSRDLVELSPNVTVVDPPFNPDTLVLDMASRVAEQVESTLFPARQSRVDPEPKTTIALATMRDASVSELLYALANDPSENVREGAAMNLAGSFLQEPGVREALEYAAETDATEWLRNKIRLSILSETEREQVLQATVLDGDRTEMERLVAFGQLSREPSAETVAAMVRMAQSSDVPEMRAKVWLSLNRQTGDAYLVQPLLDALANDSSELVRDAAAKGLAQFVDEARVYEALQEAMVNDSSPLVREAASEVLVAVNR